MQKSDNAVIHNRLTKEAYTVAEVARMLEPPVNPVTIYRQIYAGNIKVLQGFGRIIIPRSEIARFFNQIVAYTPRKRRPPKHERQLSSKPESGASTFQLASERDQLIGKTRDANA
jgi:Helix-turn-helix domain